jgi:DNA-binding NtrC family response regulator
MSGSSPRPTPSLEDLVAAGEFRDDLYYRLNVIPMVLPPLRERRDDIPLLAQFLRRYAEQHKCVVPELTPAVIEGLKGHDWPGNVRELENTIERLVVLSNGKTVQPELLHRFGRPKYTLRSSRPQNDDVPGLIQKLVKVGVQTPAPNGLKLYDFLVGGLERILIEQVLRLCDGVQVKAADRLGINRNTLHKKLEQYRLADQAGKTSDVEPAEESGPPEEG